MTDLRVSCLHFCLLTLLQSSSHSPHFYNNIRKMGFQILILISIAVAACTAAGPAGNATYVLQSIMDGERIAPSGSGEVCGGLSSLLSFYLDDGPYPDRFYWKLTINKSTGYGVLHSEGSSTSNRINQLTYEDLPPYCYLVYRELEFVEIGEGPYYEIKSVSDGKCLTSWGSEVGILFFHPCGDVGQGWYLYEAQP